ncbi:hypothetical protein AAFF_G00079460 [Aldrovandia affinis]|uniref:Uncharacterized protein n=1 Tax=Aldrovandia affinis TaxID=143900 RepID=A0AAD7RXL0_9TELE|nr:hypothetical protein AAFF_G00079460 [Aldrovandia affinis]
MRPDASPTLGSTQHKLSDLNPFSTVGHCGTEVLGWEGLRREGLRGGRGGWTRQMAIRRILLPARFAAESPLLHRRSLNRAPQYGLSADALLERFKPNTVQPGSSADVTRRSQRCEQNENSRTWCHSDVS